MNNATAKIIGTFKRSPSRVAVIAGVFSLIGVILLIRSFAAVGTAVSIEAESATPIGAAEIKMNDATASGNGYLVFQPNAVTPSPTPTASPTPTTTPDPELPGGGWYKITADTFETTRVTLKSGSKTINQPTSLSKYDDGNFATAQASAIVGFKDKLTNNEYLETSSGPNGVLLAQFYDGYAYDTTGASFSNPQVNGNCVTADYKSGRNMNYKLTMCKGHSVIKVEYANPGVLGEEDKIKNLTGTADNRTYSVVGVANDLTGKTALMNAWRASSAECSNLYGFNDPKNSQAMYCQVKQMGGNPDNFYYKDYAISGLYDKASGQGVGFAYPKHASYQVGSMALSGLNPFWADEKGMEWEYLNRGSSATVVRYIYPMSGGKAELESLGKQAVDGSIF